MRPNDPLGRLADLVADNDRLLHRRESLGQTIDGLRVLDRLDLWRSPARAARIRALSHERDSIDAQLRRNRIKAREFLGTESAR